jgi:hypothetical protein
MFQASKDSKFICLPAWRGNYIFASRQGGEVEEQHQDEQRIKDLQVASLRVIIFTVAVQGFVLAALYPLAHDNAHPPPDGAERIWDFRLPE